MPIKSKNNEVIIVGAGLAGLSCARRLMEEKIPFILLDADQRIGGRLKTDNLDEFILNHGFQVLQTAYSEARRLLDFDRLELRPFAPGAMIRIGGKFHCVADPKRRPRDLLRTLQAPIGGLADRLRIIKLARKVCQTNVSALFQNPDMPAIDLLRAEGFSEKIIQRFFKPFFAGVCLDPEIRASSRVFQYIFRIFAEGDVALPGRGMAAIPQQLAESLPDAQIRTGMRVESISEGEIFTASGERFAGRAVVLAADSPETARLLGARSSVASLGEVCLYFSARKPPITEPYLLLNGDDTGWVNSLTVPSMVAPTYAPDGQHLISVVVIGHPDADHRSVEHIVRKELIEWFGSEVADWRHLKTYRIPHALPVQPPPMPDPTAAKNPLKPGIYVCGEYESVPGIQWALLSGRRAAEAVVKRFAGNARPRAG